MAMRFGSAVSDHIGHGPNASTSQRQPHRQQGGFHHRFEIPAFFNL
jgi:hypothetical protein